MYMLQGSFPMMSIREDCTCELNSVTSRMFNMQCVYLRFEQFHQFLSPPRVKQEVIDREQVPVVQVQGWSLSFIFSGIHLSLHIGTSTAVQWNVFGIYLPAYRQFFFFLFFSFCQFELDAKSLKVQLTRIFMYYLLHLFDVLLQGC